MLFYYTCTVKTYGRETDSKHSAVKMADGCLHNEVPKCLRCCKESFGIFKKKLYTKFCLSDFRKTNFEPAVSSRVESVLTRPYSHPIILMIAQPPMMVA